MDGGLSQRILGVVAGGGGDQEIDDAHGRHDEHDQADEAYAGKIHLARMLAVAVNPCYDPA